MHADGDSADASSPLLMPSVRPLESRRRKVTPRMGMLLGFSGVIFGLLAVGLVSHTPLRHLIQVLPAVLALIAAARQTPWARFAALPVFAFWLLIMVGIWLFLLGLARIITGHYSPAEILLTVLIGISSLVGTGANLRTAVPAGWRRALAAGVGFALLQVGAMWLSLQPAFASS